MTQWVSSGMFHRAGEIKMVLYKAGSVAVHGVGLGVGLVGWVWGWFKVIVQGVGSGCWFRVLVQGVGSKCWYRVLVQGLVHVLVRGVGSRGWFRVLVQQSIIWFGSGAVQGLFRARVWVCKGPGMVPWLVGHGRKRVRDEYANG